MSLHGQQYIQSRLLIQKLHMQATTVQAQALTKSVPHD